jgi:hypothetical protein
MSSDVWLTIFDPREAAVAATRWIGMGQTVDALRGELQRPPDVARTGFESWGRVTAEQAFVVARAHYVGSATPDDIAILAERFPDGQYWWMFERHF